MKYFRIEYTLKEDGILEKFYIEVLDRAQAMSNAVQYLLAKGRSPVTIKAIEITQEQYLNRE